MDGVKIDRDIVRRDAETPEAAQPETLAEAASSLSRAFVKDPLFDWFLREDGRREAVRLRFFERVLRESAFPDGVIERPASGGAAAVWMPSEKLSSQPLTRELRALPMLLAATGLSRFPRLTRLRRAMDQRHPMERPHDYLWFLGVSPELQGLGVGSRLLAARTRALDAAGRPAFLETATPRNLALYNRHGFEIITDFRSERDAPLIWGLWREPRGER